MEQIKTKILEWFRIYRRPLPWRETKDPYRVWLSEIILQQTRVKQGLPYYKKFIRAFPTIFHLANAKEKDVLKLWQGLGYYSRARNLHQTAKDIAHKYNGYFPPDHNTLKKLSGIGDYTASAIISICFGKPYEVLDGNVYRVISRIFGIRKPYNTPQGEKLFKEKARQLLTRDDPGTFNQALMDFGALQCTPRQPHCSLCPLFSHCKAYQLGIVNHLPVKIKHLKKRKRYFHYFCITNGNDLVLKKRLNKDIWQNLYDLPLIETKSNKKIGDRLYRKQWGINAPIKFQTQYKHTLTHQTIIARFYFVRISDTNRIPENAFLVPDNQLLNYPFPRLIERFLKENVCFS